MGLPANYYNFFEICKFEEIPEGTAKAAIGKGVDGINKITKLKPIAHLFHTFPKGERNQYGILQKHYDRWKRTGEVPKISPGRPKEKPDDCENWNDWIPKPLALKFKEVVDNANRLAPHNRISYKQARRIAYQEFIDRRPGLQGGGNHEK